MEPGHQAPASGSVSLKARSPASGWEGDPALCTRAARESRGPGPGPVEVCICVFWGRGPCPHPSWLWARLPVVFPPWQPLVFGAMVHRDEAFETIFSQYVKITAAAASGSDS